MPLERLVHETEQKIGRRIVLRSVHPPEPEFRGRISPRPGYLLVEYRDDTAGYFWHYDTIKELLELVATGHRDIVLHDWDGELRQFSPE